MRRKKQKEAELRENQERMFENQEKKEWSLFKKQTIKEIIAPTGIDASELNSLEIISATNKLARSFYVSNLPRMATFPSLFRDLYNFGDVNVSLYINPVGEERSQKELNKIINELETERMVAQDRGSINRESDLSYKKSETEQLRDEIAAGFNK